MGDLDFEKPIVELRKKIDELKEVTDRNDMDFYLEIHHLENRLENLEKEIYGNMCSWDRVQIARHSERPTTSDYIEHLFTDFVECHGDRLYGDDKAIIGGIARFHGKPVTVIGHQRGKDTKENLQRNFGMPHPEGYRKALRLMKQAEKFKRPIICFVDTKGAYPGKAAEERGQSEAIARNLFEMSSLTVPIISIVIGEGGSGGALALSMGNHIYMLENATYSVISPEGAASILWKDAAQAKQAAESMKITAQDLLEFCIIDGMINEVKGGAHKNIHEQVSYIDKILKESLESLLLLSEEELITQRHEKFNQIGIFSYQNELEKK